MAYKHSTTRVQTSEQFPGVSYALRKMTEGRRMELRKIMAPNTARVLAIMREQDVIAAKPENERDYARELELQDEYDEIKRFKMDPAWIMWGVKSIDGLEIEDEKLTVDDWAKWPSALFNEILDAVMKEAQLNGAERKNSESPTTSGELAGENPNLSIVKPAGSTAGGDREIAESTTMIV